MLKKIIIAGALATCSLAQAEVQHLKAVYQGFYDVHAGKFDVMKRLTAYFDVNDFNQDGTYSYNEVLNFSIDYNYMALGAGCDEVFLGSWSCLNNFSYTPGSNPTFSADLRESDELFPWGISVVAGQYYEFNSARWPDDLWNWTPETRTYVVASNVTVPLPVPEPAQYGMLAVGLAGMLALARRRRG